jgi:hypothetical protein
VLLPLTAVLAVLTGQTRFDLLGQVRVSTDLRTPYVGDNPKFPVVADVTATPSLTGSLEHGGGRALLNYTPTVRIREPYDVFRRIDAYQTASFFMQWYREGRPRPYFSQSLAYGVADWASIFNQNAAATGANQPGGHIPGGEVGGVAPMTQQPVINRPRVQGTFDQLLFNGSAGVAWPIGRLITLDTGGSWVYGGGTDLMSQTIMPTEALARAHAQLDVITSRVDTLMARLDYMYVDFSKGPTVLSVFSEVDATARWRRMLSPIITLQANFGAGTIRGWPGGLPRPTWGVVPVAQALLTTRLASGPHAIIFDVAAGAAPFVDPFLAQVYERFDSAGTFLYTFRTVYQLSLRGGVAQSIGQVPAIFTTFVEGKASYVPPHLWRIDLTAADSAAQYGAQLINTWLVSLSVTFRIEGMF